MADDTGRSASFWIGPDEEGMVEEFNQRFCAEPGAKFSEQVKRAMRLAIVVDKALSTAPWSFDRERDMRAYVRQAITNEISRERED